MEIANFIHRYVYVTISSYDNLLALPVFLFLSIAITPLVIVPSNFIQRCSNVACCILNLAAMIVVKEFRSNGPISSPFCKSQVLIQCSL